MNYFSPPRKKNPVKKKNGRHQLYFGASNNLPEIITSEIRFAFKLAFLNEGTRNKFVCGSCPFSTPISNSKSHAC